MRGIFVVAAIFMMGLVLAKADTGHEGAARIYIGDSVSAVAVTGSSTTGTAFVNPSFGRADGTYFNNTASVVWIGTTSATMNGALHTNIKIGFPVLSSTTFHLGGSFSGTIYFTCNSGVAACEMRELEGTRP